MWDYAICHAILGDFMVATMTSRERNWCLAYAFFLVAVTTLPYILGYAVQDDEWHFTGFLFGVEDGNSYIAKMLLGSQGAWLFRTPYTSLQQRGVVAFLPYLLLGKIAAGVELHQQLVALYHLLRVIATPLAVLANYQFISLFVRSERWRRWATVLATAGGGLGWLLVILGKSPLLGSLPLDFYSPETFGFLAFFGLPHLVLARALLLIGLVNYLRSPGSARRGWIAGVCFLGLTLVQPLAVISAFAVIAIHQIVLFSVLLIRRRWRSWLPWFGVALRVVVIPLPMIIYLAIAFLRDPFLQVWTTQNRILSPHPVHYAVGYGLLALPALLGGWRLVREGDNCGLLLVTWVLAFPVLAYAPHNLQRRLPDGVWVALVTLSAVGFAGWRLKETRLDRWIGWAVLILALPSSLMLVAGGFGVALTPSEPSFRPAVEVEAIQWLSGEVEPGSLVMAAFESGNALPAWAPVRVVIGHGPESADLQTMSSFVGGFYDDEMSDEERIDFIHDKDIGYVWRGPHERELGSWDPAGVDFLTLIYRQGDYEIYRVLHSP